MARRAVGIAASAAAAALLTMPGGAADVVPGPFSLSARQAQEVGVLTGFLDAFNRRQLRRALSYLSRDAGVTDCDYRRVRAVQLTGKAASARWLTQRFADRDTLYLGRLYNENAEQPSGVLAAEFSLRVSKTLRALGFARGIKPQLTAKVIFTQTGTPKITRFANGPSGGSPEACRPQ